MAGSTGKPRIILGLMTFGPPGSEEHGTRISSLSDFQECLDTFKNRGYNEVDTARTYVDGLQEAFTREAQWQERGLSVATKWYPHNPGEHAAPVIKKQLEKSLSELGCEKVDTFYLHAPDRTVSFKETLQACNELYNAGKFKRLGLSNYAAWEVAEICTLARENGWVRPSVYQAMYNALTRAIEEELIPCCRKFGLSIAAYNPLAGGVLSGKYTQAKDAPTQGRFSNIDPVVGDMYRKRYFRDENFEALRLLQPLAEEHGLTLPEIAFRWCVHHSKLDVLGGGDGVVIGVSSLAQLEANLRDLEKGPLPEAVVQALDEAWESFTKRSCPLYWR
jgi:aflatoxin B1 aldehyde reductase